VKRFTTALLTLLIVTAGCAGPWKGKILDSDTREPLEGAVVLAVWERVYRTPAGGNSYFCEAKESVTNQAGEFDISSYTPVNLLPLISYMRGPVFTVFKPGYGSLSGLALGGFFTGEKKAEQDYQRGGERYSFAPYVVTLPKLKTLEERKKFYPGLLMYDEANKKAKNYMRLLNVEAAEIGIDPYPLDMNSK
jgi:hypothetical protein